MHQGHMAKLKTNSSANKVWHSATNRLSILTRPECVELVVLDTTPPGLCRDDVWHLSQTSSLPVRDPRYPWELVVRRRRRGNGETTFSPPYGG
jgi:hypothetical protein